MSVELVMEQVGFAYRGGHRAVDGVDLRLGAGVLGLLGPNGAGKSSLMRLLATLTRATSGRVTWRGDDIAKRPDALRAELGYLPQDFGVYDALDAREFLGFLAAVKGLGGKAARSRVDECLEMVGLADTGGRRLGEFSGGMRQRVGIAQALLNEPALLIFDEPTVGLDPDERMRFQHLITDLAGQRLVILSTHIVSDVEASATGIAVLAAGQLRFHGTPGQLIAQAVGHVWEWTVPEAQLASVRAAHTLVGSLRLPEGIRVRVVSDVVPDPLARAATPGLQDAYTWLLKGAH
ncbi:ATP-binding cassette domain-containing protein [Lysobacter xanthus]